MSDEYEKFMETLNSPRRWESLDNQSLFQFAYDAIYTYGHTNNLELIPLIRHLYIYFIKRTETEERWNLYQSIVREVNNNNISVFAFIPFLYEEIDKGIVSTAAIDYCAYRPLDNDDPLTAVKEIIPRIIQQKNVECRYGLFGGLLCLGDRRVNNMLWQIKHRLLPDEVKFLVTVQTGILYANTFEFYMHWLEELKEDSGNQIFGSVASGIVFALRQAQNLQKTDEPTVIDHERVFPSPKDVSPSNLKKEYKFSEYRDLITPRLLAITDKETGARVMPFVLKVWGIPFENKMTPQRLIVDKSFWLQKDGKGHMTWNIFNPNGPTLNCIGSFSTEDEYVDAIFYRWLHFLKDESYILGYVDRRNNEWHKEYVNILENAFCNGPNESADNDSPVLVTCIPSIVTESFPDEREDLAWNLLSGAPVICQAEWGRELYYLKKYGANLFDRAGEETREAIQEMKAEYPRNDFITFSEIRHSQIKTFTDKTPIEYELMPISKEAFDYWRRIISEEEFLQKATVQFSMAWVGAISIGSENLPVITQFEDVRNFLAHYKHKIWEQEITTEALKEALGLDETSNPMPESSLKELLKQDFGLDLNIAGGSGQSREDPIFVLSDTENEAAQTELSVLRGIGKGRNLSSKNRDGGFLWRPIAINLISESSPQIIQRKIETKEIRTDEIVTQIESYYFSRKNLDTKAEQIQSHVVAHEDQRASIRFPHELGWLHFGEIVDYESQSPGLGYSLAYSGYDTEATVYVYPIQDDAKSQPSLLHAEMELARKEIILVHGEDAIKHDWGGVITEKDFLLYDFILKPINDPKFYSPQNPTSRLMISERKGYFIKLRCTFFDEPLLRDISNNFLVSLLELIRSGGDAPA
jgi:hypothetical protein